MKTTEEYLKLIDGIGFKQALKVDFKRHENRNEALYIFWYEECGILLCFNTYGDNLNGGSFYYNWIPSGKDEEAVYKYTSSGGFRKFDDEFIWIGDHDCRNNIDINIKNLEENGKFVVPWAERPFLWLLHYMDDERHTEEWKLVNERRILQLPKDIQIAIEGKYD